MWAGAKKSAMSAAEYYRCGAVRDRIREYCGLGNAAASCRFLAVQTGRSVRESSWEETPFRPPGSLDRILSDGSDVSRSLWDEGGFLFFIDVDYQNPDRPAEPFVHPIETFFKLEPAYRAVRDTLHDFGLNPLNLLTGEGYHFTGHVPEAHPISRRLEDLAPAAPPWLASQRARLPAWSTYRMDESTARAYVGYGLVLEHLAHAILRRAAATSEVPVVLHGTVVGAGPNGRECISLDLSHVAYPLDVRHVRAAFSAYQKHIIRPDIYGHPVAGGIPACAMVIRNGTSLLGALEASRDLQKAASLAGQCSAALPDLAEGMTRLLDSYLGSTLRRSHVAFYSTPADPAGAAADLRQLRRDGLPPCISSCLDQPNDLLLRPEYIQLLTRFLLSRGWAPRRIAGAIQALYEGDHGWGERWVRMDPEWRADVYVRSFAGAIADGLDQAIDFNCVSTREKGMCTGGMCGHNLADDRAALLAGKAS
jgi:hypothetical protein